MARRFAPLLLVACAVLGAGCGSGTSAGGPATTLVVTRDFGSSTLFAAASVPATSGLTAMRQLQSKRPVTTKYGGRYVESVGGTKEDNDSSWLYYVDGVESPSAATAQRLSAGQTVQWDFHAWQNVRTGGAIVGAYPAPLKSRGVHLVCAEQKSKSCTAARAGLQSSGVPLRANGGARLVVGPYSEIVGFDGVPNLEAPGDTNGAYAQFSKNDAKLTPVAADGSDGKAEAAGAGLLAAFASGKQLTWVATGTDDAGAAAAAALLADGGAALRNHFALLTAGGTTTSLPEVATG